MKFLLVFVLALATTSAFQRPVSISELRKGRIINGYEAYTGLFPYQAGLDITLQDQRRVWCGGSLIDNKWILTAAHCVHDAVSVVVYLGSAVQYEGEAVVNSERIISHSMFNPETYLNDVALIKIPHVEYGDNIQPIRLPSGEELNNKFENVWATVSGWGQSNTDTVILQYTYNLVIDNDRCAQEYPPGIIVDSTICGDTSNGKSPCFGDSGGPFVLTDKNLLIGVVSFVSGAGCESGKPVGFARVTSYMDWIQQNTGIIF
uniref:trypsin n=1 Tax=Hypoderma bovis TaxID=123734 RepID=A0A5B9T3C1_HYPBO|nr:hypodermin C [Hypoderma bovis]